MASDEQLPSDPVERERALRERGRQWFAEVADENARDVAADLEDWYGQNRKWFKWRNYQTPEFVDRAYEWPYRRAIGLPGRLPKRLEKP